MKKCILLFCFLSCTLFLACFKPNLSTMPDNERQELNKITEKYYNCIVKIIANTDDFKTDIETLADNAIYLCKKYEKESTAIIINYDGGEWSSVGYNDAMREDVKRRAIYTSLNGRKTKYQ